MPPRGSTDGRPLTQTIADAVNAESSPALSAASWIGRAAGTGCPIRIRCGSGARRSATSLPDIGEEWCEVPAVPLGEGRELLPTSG